MVPLPMKHGGKWDWTKVDEQHILWCLIEWFSANSLATYPLRLDPDLKAKTRCFWVACECDTCTPLSSTKHHLFLALVLLLALGLVYL